MDNRAVEKYLIPEDILMENAGLSACSVIKDRYGIRHNSFLIICATGNNGGDGLVVARSIHSRGGNAIVFILGNREKYKSTSRVNLARLLSTSVEVFDLSQDTSSMDRFKEALQNRNIVVDAIFGTGLVREVKGFYADIINLINGSGKKVVSLDIPSGVNGNTGQIMGISVKADVTITFGLPKYGNLLYPGYDHCGKLYVTHISFPPPLYHDDSINVRINLPPQLKKRDPVGYKGSFGDVLFIAGSSSYYGAPYLSAFSFLKAGGGYSRLAAPASIVPFIATRAQEIVFIPLKETESQSISSENIDLLLEAAGKVDMVVMGPGISLDPDTSELVCLLAEKIEKPLLLDGDGITALSSSLEILKMRKCPTILTPHPGEMSRMTGLSVKEIKERSISVLMEAAQRNCATIVLKQAHSLIGCPGGEVFINLSGNCGMATAGSGDVLTGTIAAMTGLGLSVREAVQAGVFIHGLAGDLAAIKIGEDGLTAGDILEFLPAALAYYRDNYYSIQEHCYDKVFSL
jgi:NAD(P)H-hydrate epimerase